jgi:hypothetical protein
MDAGRKTLLQRGYTFSGRVPPARGVVRMAALRAFVRFFYRVFSRPDVSAIFPIFKLIYGKVWKLNTSSHFILFPG